VTRKEIRFFLQILQQLRQNHLPKRRYAEGFAQKFQNKAFQNHKINNPVDFDFIEKKTL